MAVTICLAFSWTIAALTLIGLRWIDPPTTAVQTQRRLQALSHGTPYQKHYRFLPMAQISPELQHAVVAAEDARFYQHHGFDWHEIQIAAEDDLEGTRARGASTLTQQLIKNLFFGTGRSYLRKGAEFTLVPVAELVLGKQRILELYLNVVEWGPGIYGAEAAARYHYEIRTRSQPRRSCAPRRDPSLTAPPPPRAHDALQHAHPDPHAPDGVVTSLVPEQSKKQLKNSATERLRHEQRRSDVPHPEEMWDA